MANEENGLRDHRLTVRLGSRLMQGLEHVAGERGLTPSQAIRESLRFYIPFFCGYAALVLDFESEKISSGNPYAEDLFGLESYQFVGRDIRDFVADGDHAKIPHLAATLRNEGLLVGVPIEMRRADGSTELRLWYSRTEQSYSGSTLRMVPTILLPPDAGPNPLG